MCVYQSVLTLLFFVVDLVSGQKMRAEELFDTSTCVLNSATKQISKCQKRRFSGHSVITDFFSEIVRDIFDLHYELVSGESFCIIAATIPPFIAARMADDPFHACFYNKKHHKNRHQLPGWCQRIARYIISIPAILFGIQALFAKDLEFRFTGQLLIVGLPFVIFGKDILKHLDFQCGKRPWNEHFSCEKRSGGGFPSGHVAESAFVAALYGLRFGPRYAVPLSIGAAFVAGTFVNCNRHYLSQVVAGAGLGILYAVAANKVVNSRLRESYDCQCAITMGDRGEPALSFTAKF